MSASPDDSSFTAITTIPGVPESQRFWRTCVTLLLCCFADDDAGKILGKCILATSAGNGFCFTASSVTGADDALTGKSFSVRRSGISAR
jgi:hypothetical protein